MAEVAVLGSANLDLVYAVREIPRPGETVLASGPDQHPGGKGLNQAVAAARAGASVVFLGALGDDPAAAVLRAALGDAGIDADLTRRVPLPSGTALITVDRHGENAIVVAPGANAALTALDARERAAIGAARVLVAQLEVPLEAIAEGVAAAREAATLVVLNAAPARPLEAAILDGVDVLVVNEGEGRLLAGADSGDVRELARSLAAGGRAAVVTLGADGAVWAADGEVGLVPAHPATVVDTTGAGDTFTGVLAAALAEGRPLAAAVERAIVAGALAVERAGAVPSIPTRAEVDARIGVG